MRKRREQVKLRKWLIRFVVSVFALFVVSWIVPGVKVVGLLSAVEAAILLGFVNAFIRPILKLFTFPLNCMTFGLFSFVINAFLFWVVGSGFFLSGFRVEGALASLEGSLLMGFVGWLFNYILNDRI